MKVQTVNDILVIKYVSSSKPKISYTSKEMVVGTGPGNMDPCKVKTNENNETRRYGLQFYFTGTNKWKYIGKSPPPSDPLRSEK